jgi:succinoglycan biosynthesis transport protein ExoP
MRELAMVLFRRRRVFVGTAGLIVLLAVVYAIAGTKYQANMKILVRRGRAEAPVSAVENAPLDLTRMTVTEEELNSEVELLRGQELMQKIVERSGLRGRDWFHFLRIDEGPQQRKERATRALAKTIKIEPLKRTNLIAVSYASANPEKAARVLKSLADAYLEKHTNVHRPTGELNFFDQQMEDSRRRVEESNRRLLQFSQLHGVVMASQQRDLALQKLSELDAEGARTRIEIADTQQRVRELGQQVSTLPERTTTQVRMSDNPELMKALKSNLLELQQKRTELLMKFEANHRLVKEVEAQIEQVQTAVAVESISPLRDETTDKNSNYEWAKAELQRAQVQLKALQSRDEAIHLQQAALRAQAEKLGEAAVTQDDLAGSARAAQESYLLYVKKREEARMNDALDQRGIVNVAIAEEPVVPALPVWSAWTVLAIGFLGSVVAGTGAALVADYFDPVFRDPEDVLACLNAPVLACLPRQERGRLWA